MIYGFLRGWKIIYNKEKGKWLYVDTKEIYVDNRPCKECNKMPTKEGHDACLGILKDVQAACCGHGVEEGYVIKNSVV